MEHIRPQSGGKFTTDPEHGHEETDINIKSILGFGVFLMISGVVIHVLLWGFFRWMEKENDKSSAAPTPVVQQMKETERARSGAVPAAPAAEGEFESQKHIVERLKAEFPTPRLQDNDVHDMKQLRANEETYLNDYSWIDKSKGEVRIPVARAMEIIAQRGLPVVVPQAAPAKAGTPAAVAKPAAKK